MSSSMIALEIFSDSYAVLLVGIFLSHIFGDSWLSSLVRPSLDCVYYIAVFGVVYYMMAHPLVLNLL